MEIRVPTRLIQFCLAGTEGKNGKHVTYVKHLRLLVTAKLVNNHRIHTDTFLESIEIHPKTGKRLISQMEALGWVTPDGKYLFLRSWSKLGYKRRGGLYLTRVIPDLKCFEALCFAHALKKLYLWKARRLRMSKALPELSTGYCAATLELSLRRFIRLRATAQRYGFIAIHRRFLELGDSRQLKTLQENIHGPPVFRRQKKSVSPALSRVIFNI